MASGQAGTYSRGGKQRSRPLVVVGEGWASEVQKGMGRLVVVAKVFRIVIVIVVMFVKTHRILH